MSRVAKAPILIPNGVEVTISNENLTIKGPKGSLTHKCNRLVSVNTEDGQPKKLCFKPASNDPNAWAQAGTIRAIANNMVIGVTNGFERTLELVGVGYRAQVKGKSGISLSLGYSHPVEYELPEGVIAETPNNTTIILKGVDNQLLGQVAAELRAFRSPEPYKGKGIRYAGEQIVRKEAKKK